MKNLTTRLLVGIVLVVLVSTGTSAVRWVMVTPEVILPQRELVTMPMQFEQWRGEVVDLDPEIFARTDAAEIVQRRYRNSEGRMVSVFTAIYSDPDAGVYHNPMNCYRAQGWQKDEDEYWELQVEGCPQIPVRATVWQQAGKRVLVVYWYRFGEHTLFSRYDMGTVRLKMAGKDAWPAMFKVLVETPLDDSQSAEAAARELAGHVHRWLEKPEDQPEAGASSG